MTLVGYGAQMQVLRSAHAMAKDKLGVSCELLDLRTIIPWDVDTVAQVIHVYQRTLKHEICVGYAEELSLWIFV